VASTQTTPEDFLSSLNFLDTMWSRRDPSSHVSRPSRQLDDVTCAVPSPEDFCSRFHSKIGFIWQKAMNTFHYLFSEKFDLDGRTPIIILTIPGLGVFGLLAPSVFFWLQFGLVSLSRSLFCSARSLKTA
jgi:hypothetical protein